jgi:hypothetical protein
MVDWRENYSNCYSCAEFQDHDIETIYCSDCQCFNCEYNRQVCYKNQWCKAENAPIKFNV